MKTSAKYFGLAVGA